LCWVTNRRLHISKEKENYLLSGGIQQDESGQQLHCGKPDQSSNISLEQKVSDQCNHKNINVTNHSIGNEKKVMPLPISWTN
jgi:hypothetical protein